MAIKFIPYSVEPLRGQAVLPFLRYRKQLNAKDFYLQGLPLFETELVEKVGKKNTDQSKNLLIHGDCLNACAYLKDLGIKVDLVYIDPPFASGANYAKKIYIRRNPKLVAKLEEAEAKLKAEAGKEIDNKDLQVLEETMYGDIWQKEDYLNWMYERLLAIKEVMNDTASIYVHLDWHIGHYVKILLDEIFGEENFKNEIIWYYWNGGGRSRDSFNSKHDTILWYSNSHTCVYNGKEAGDKRNADVGSFGGYFKKDADERLYQEVRANGKIYKYYVDELKNADDVWTIGIISQRDETERQYYVTQKPEELLEKIIKASSKEGDSVADFFSGSGTTARVAHDLGRRFVTVDVGINAIQTTRDRLVEAGASFDILKINDGIDLFRNPAQTMSKLSSIIPSLTTKHEYGDFWFGAITDNGSVCPCWVPDLLDKKQAIVNAAQFSIILDETAKLEGVSKVVICSVDKVDDAEITKMIKDYDLRDNDGNQIQFVFKDLKELIDLLIHPDIIEYSINKKGNEFKINFDRFVSDILIQKIDEFNAKKVKGKTEIEISDEGLELIEYISVDCTNKEGVWKSDYEIKIDKKGYVIENGEKTKKFWNGKVVTDKKPLRIKVRNIAGDETTLEAS